MAVDELPSRGPPLVVARAFHVLGMAGRQPPDIRAVGVQGLPVFSAKQRAESQCRNLYGEM